MTTFETTVTKDVFAPFVNYCLQLSNSGEIKAVVGELQQYFVPLYSGINPKSRTVNSWFKNTAKNNGKLVFSTEMVGSAKRIEVGVSTNSRDEAVALAQGNLQVIRDWTHQDGDYVV